MDFLESLADGAEDKPVSREMRQAMAVRRNTPSGELGQILRPSTPEPDRSNRLWVIDRILEPQTIMHAIEFFLRGKLWSGQKTSLPILSEDDTKYLRMPMSSWAPAPFNQEETSTIDACMINIGSFEDSARLVTITKEVEAMKGRIWEGVMSLSERRWAELELDSPENFSHACKCLCAVIDVFHYLNNPKVKADLRETYNRIWQHFDKFDKAFQSIESKASASDILIAVLWHEYIKDHYEFISSRAHRWVIEHIDRLRAPILAQQTNDELIDTSGVRNEQKFALADKIHDLYENGAQTDSAIFLPMDGYKGEALPAQDDVRADMSNPYRDQPISFTSNIMARKVDYYGRLKYLSRLETWTVDKGDVRPSAISRSQIRAQMQARAELRGDQAPSEVQELWVQYANRFLSEFKKVPLGFVGYRAYYGCRDDEWEQFKTKFSQDAENWGYELKGIDLIRAISTVEWEDIKDLMPSDGDAINAAKHAFAELAADKNRNRYFRDNIFLVADKAAIDSYLDPTHKGSGNVLAVEATFDKNHKDPKLLAESPGYDGWLRILSSLLWDDVSALLLVQRDNLASLWPLAQNDAQKIYRHPLGPTRARV